MGRSTTSSSPPRPAACGASSLERGEEPPTHGLRAMVPVNLRAAGEHLGLGNKITSLFVHLPVAEPEPGRRYELQMSEAEALKSGRQALGSRDAHRPAGARAAGPAQLPRPLAVRDPSVQRHDHQRPRAAGDAVRARRADARGLAAGPDRRRARARDRDLQLRRAGLLLRQRRPRLGPRPRRPRRRIRSIRELSPRGPTARSAARADAGLFARLSPPAGDDQDVAGSPSCTSSLETLPSGSARSSPRCRDRRRSGRALTSAAAVRIAVAGGPPTTQRSLPSSGSKRSISR